MSLGARDCLSKGGSQVSRVPAKPRTPGAGARSCNRAPPRRGRRAEASARGPGGPGGAGGGVTQPVARPGKKLHLRPSRARGCARPQGACALPRGSRSLPAHLSLLPLPPPLPPRLSPLLLASGVLKLGGWQQTGSARGPSSSASRPRTHRCAAHTSRRLGKMLPLIPSCAK